MGTIGEYSIGKCLHASRRSQIHAGRRRSDGREVVLKTYAGEGESVACAERELWALREAAGPGIVAALDVIRDATQITLVHERIPGMSLREWVASRAPLSAAEFTAIALQLADALIRVHAARLIHCDVNPDHVLVEPQTLKTCLIGFRLARTLGSAADADKSSKPIGADLRYISPEQTGRMDRGVDSRSDLYSLGATLYFALTGQPPFPGGNALALIHAHIARRPTPPYDLRPGLQATLSRIVMRLLQKSPEERYQRAASLQTDLLHCQDELERTGAIQDEFSLGSADVPYRPLFSKRLYGRGQEIQSLLTCYRSAAAGQSTVMLLQGGAGIGKSALVHELRPSLVRDGGHLAVGKFDLYRREQPYLGFAEALRGVAEQLLTESDARLKRWRNTICDALSSGAGAIVDLAPEFGFVLGEVAPSPRLGPMETRLRLGLALQRLVQALATPEHPLVIFLDDLQWADAGSRDLLSDVILDPSSRALLLVCAYRDNEVDARHPLPRFWDTLRGRGVTLHSLELAPLGEDACAEMLAEALGRSPTETRTLAQCVARKTGNAPLLIQQFVQHMHDEGLIAFRAEVGWSWNDAELAAAQIPESAVELLTAKISRLPHKVAAVLQLASCVGNAFDLDLLTELSDRPRTESEKALFALCDDGLIAPAPQGFRFLHDRIREAAQVLISREERARLHGRAAQLLLERTSPTELDERIFEIADHVNEASSAGLRAIDPARTVEINVRACRRALGAGAGATAWHYFAAGEAQFAAELWASHPALCFDLFVQGADAAHQCEQFDQANRCIAVLLERPLPPMQRIQVLSRQVRSSSVTQPRLATVHLTLRLLRQYGIRWSRNPSSVRLWWEVLRTDWHLRHDVDEKRFQPCPPEHLERIAAILLISAAGQSLSMTSHRLVLLAAGLVLRGYMRFGFLISPSFALAAYAAYRLRFTGRTRSAARCVQASHLWNQKIPNPMYVSRSEMLALAYVAAWMEPRHPLIERLHRVSEVASEAGDFEYACLSEAIRQAMMPIIGWPLPDYEREIHRLSWSQWSYAMSVAHTTASRIYSVLHAGTDLKQAVTEVNSAHQATQDLYLYMSIGIILVHLVLGESERAFEEAERVREPMFCAQIGTHIADYVFLRGWAAASVARTARGALRRSARRALRQSLGALRRWAHPGSDFVHMHQPAECGTAVAAGQPARRSGRLCKGSEQGARTWAPASGGDRSRATRGSTRCDGSNHRGPRQPARRDRTVREVGSHREGGVSRCRPADRLGAGSMGLNARRSIPLSWLESMLTALSFCSILGANACTKGKSLEVDMEDATRSFTSETESAARAVTRDPSRGLPLDPSALESAPGTLAVTQPVAVYLQWLTAGTLIGAYVLSYPLTFLVERAAQFVPTWSQVGGAGAIFALLLTMIERAKRNRRPFGYFLNVLAVLLVGLAMHPEILSAYPVARGWALVVVGTLYATFHLILLEDWLTGRAGPGFHQFAAALSDLATIRWWFWFSKGALLQRSRRAQVETQLREQRERARVERLGAEDRAATAAAERRAAEENLAKSQAAMQAALSEKEAAAAQQGAAESAAQGAIAEQELARAQEAKVRWQRLSLEAERDLVRVRAEFICAERLLLEAAVAARAAAEGAALRDVECCRAERLLESALIELERLNALPREEYTACEGDAQTESELIRGDAEKSN